MIETYPLRWPATWPRTAKPVSSQFKTGLRDARNGLLLELQRLGARDINLTSMVVRNQNGSQSKVQPKQMDQGVAVYFTLHGNERCIPCDKWLTMADNIHAIELTVAALRGLERWGAKELIDHAFAGFAALPSSTSAEGWWDVLGLPSPNVTFNQVDAAYRAKAKETHPDAGGSTEAFQRVSEAFVQGKAITLGRNPT